LPKISRNVIFESHDLFLKIHVLREVEKSPLRHNERLHLCEPIRIRPSRHKNIDASNDLTLNASNTIKEGTILAQKGIVAEILRSARAL
jgi:hypothetical protein